MTSPATSATANVPLDLSKWRRAPNALMVVGGVLAFVGAFVNYRQFSFSWLVAFMFCLSFGLGGLFLVLLHHLFDASWSVATRRVCEHLACLLFPTMAVLFVPIALNVAFAGHDSVLYHWMTLDPHSDHALHAKQPLFTKPAFFAVSVLVFAVWWLLTNRLRHWSLKQDETGAAECTYKMRRYAFWGIWAFAFTLTFGAIMWVKALEHEWFSTMYGVYYFADSVWVTLATLYLLTLALKRLGPLREVAQEKQFYFIGSLLFAFTVFYSYIHFSQYFIIWNANIPEETFWYHLREQGNWRQIGYLIIFGHFFLPFLILLRIDFKLNLMVMLPVCAWAWIMRFMDESFNVMPVLHREGFRPNWIDAACLAFCVGTLAKMFLRAFNAHAPYPQRDPRIAETMGVYVEPHPVQPGGE